MQGVRPTITPSMDIQISSNFERLLYDASGRGAGVVRAMMGSLRQSGACDLPENVRAFINARFDVGTTTETETMEVIRSAYANSGYLLDPHTAVALHVAGKYSSDETPMVTLSTAGPAKFPATVHNAAGVSPTLPAWMGNLTEEPEELVVIKNDQFAVEAYILSQKA